MAAREEAVSTGGDETRVASVRGFVWVGGGS